MKINFWLLGLLILLAGSTSAQTLYNSLVSYYPFDEVTQTYYGTTDRMSGQSATKHGVTLVPDRYGKPNSAYHFNGETWNNTKSDTIIIKNDGRFTLTEDSSFSISFWIDKFTETTELIKWGNFSLYQFANGSVGFSKINYNYRFNCMAYEKSRDQSNNEIWDHYVVTYDKGLWGVYINGDSVTETFENFTQILENSEADIYLGINASNSIDDFYFFDKKLSQEEAINLRDKDIFDFTSTPLVLKMEFNGNLQDAICQCSPLDSVGTLVEDRFGNSESAFLTSTNFKPLVFPYRSDFELSYDSSLSISFWFKAKDSEECRTDVIIGQGSFPPGNVFCMEYAAILPCSNNSVDVGKTTCLDSYGQNMGSANIQGRGGISYSTYPQNTWEHDWTHIVFTYDGNIWKLYINSELKKTISALDKDDDYSNIFSFQNNVIIGASYDSIYLDDIHYYKKVLSETDISTLYNSNDIISSSKTPTDIKNKELLLMLQIFDFTGKPLHSKANPKHSDIEKLKKQYNGIYKFQYETYVEINRFVH